MTNIDVRLQRLKRLESQCKQLQIDFPFDYEYLSTHLEDINIEIFDYIIQKNVATAKARYRRRSNSRFIEKFTSKKPKIKEKYKRKVFENKQKRNNKNVTKKKVKEKNKKRIWIRIILVGHMWRS